MPSSPISRRCAKALHSYPLEREKHRLAGSCQEIEPSLASIEKDSSLLISIADRWRANKEAATALVADASHTLEQFVSTAQESGREISQRSATMSLAAMMAGTVLAIIGGLMLIETLRGPLKRITQTMMRLADGDLNVPIGDGKRSPAPAAVELLNERISHFQTVAADGGRAASPLMSLASSGMRPASTIRPPFPIQAASAGEGCRCLCLHGAVRGSDA
ncbi:methyl-accepting chemotaxis protein [Rhizobium leguminosarum]|nr:methyl-accepting chemotaxis protein [Rhizobium leguminosarum]